MALRHITYGWQYRPEENFESRVEEMTVFHFG